MKKYIKVGLLFLGVILVFSLYLLPKRVVDSKVRILAADSESDHGHGTSVLSSVDSNSLRVFKQKYKDAEQMGLKALYADSIARIYGKNDFVDSSAKYYNQIVEILPGAEGFGLAGNGFYSLYRITQHDAFAVKAVDFYNKVLSYDSTRYELLAKVGFIKAVSGQGMPMEAVALVKKALVHDPYNVEVLLRYGELFQIRGSNSEAEEQYRKAVEIAPENLDARIYLTEALLASDKEDEAKIHLQKIKELNRGQDAFVESYVDQNLKKLL